LPPSFHEHGIVSLLGQFFREVDHMPILRRTPRPVQKDVSGFRMTLDLEDGGISQVLYNTGSRERAFMGILNAVVSEGMICLDIGANIGYNTLHMLRKVGAGGFVYAVEPDPHNVELLRKNVVDNGFSDRCEIVQCAMSNKNQTIDFWLARKPNLNSVQRTSYSTRRIKVPAYDLGTFLEPRRSLDFIKMDVEGHEVEILQGALPYFSTHPGPASILMEVHPQFYGPENDLGAILEKYFSLGFHCEYLVSTPIPQPHLFREAGYAPVASFYTETYHRGVYYRVKDRDLLFLACQEHREGESDKIVRSFLLTRD
jgi:FkbM family methyltransferase